MIVEIRYLSTLYGVSAADLIRLFSNTGSSAYDDTTSSIEFMGSRSKLLNDQRMPALKLKWKSLLQYLTIGDFITSRPSTETDDSYIETAVQDMKEFCKIVDEIKVASGIVADQSRAPIFMASNENSQKLISLSSTLYLQFIEKYCRK